MILANLRHDGADSVESMLEKGLLVADRIHMEEFGGTSLHAETLNYFLTLGIVLFIYMNVWFGVSLIVGRNDIADIAWGLGFALLAWVSYFTSGSSELRSVVANVMVTVWGLRLAWHIYSRNRHKREDYRYRAWRTTWGKWFYLRSYLQVFLLQGVFLFLISLPVLIINFEDGRPIGSLDLVGFIVWFVGFLFESVGDAQLTRFRKNPENKGKLLQSGLWRYSRHPNYFGEITQWWGVWLMALHLPGGLLSTVGPLTITVLILKVSGMPMLEKRMSLKPNYIEYKKRTSKLIPWFVRKG